MVLLSGPPGIGKSTLLRNAFQYILERKYFIGGVIMIDMKGSSDLQTLLRNLKKIVLDDMQLSYGTMRERIQKANKD